MPPGRLDVTVLNGRGLKNSQLIGRQDPFVVVHMGARHFSSPVATDEGVNPRWDFRCSFEVSTENSIVFEVKNRNVMTADVSLGRAELPLNRVFAEGKDDATVPVTAMSGHQHGYLTVILLFYPRSDGSKKGPKQGQPAHADPSYGSQGGYGQQPVMQGPPPTGQHFGGYAPPSTPAVPSAPYMQEANARPPQGYPTPQQPPAGYPTPQQPPAGYPTSHQPPAGYPTSQQQQQQLFQPPVHPGQQQQQSYPPAGYSTAHQQQQSYPPTGYPTAHQQSPGGYPTSTQSPQYFTPNQPPPGYPTMQQSSGYSPYQQTYTYPPTQYSGYSAVHTSHGQHGHSPKPHGGVSPAGYPQHQGYGRPGAYGSVPHAPTGMYVVPGKKHKHHGKKYKGKKWKK